MSLSLYELQELKITPAPWEMEKMYCRDTYEISVGENCIANEVQGEANAQLIAHAPELLDIAENILGKLDDCQEDFREYREQAHEEKKELKEALRECLEIMRRSATHDGLYNLPAIHQIVQRFFPAENLPF